MMAQLMRGRQNRCWWLFLRETMETVVIFTKAADRGSSMEMKLRDSSPDALGCGTSNGAGFVFHIAAWGCIG
jgi:hypothetical protein